MQNFLLAMDPEVACQLTPAHFAEESPEVSLPNMVSLQIVKRLYNWTPAHATHTVKSQVNRYLTVHNFVSPASYTQILKGLYIWLQLLQPETWQETLPFMFSEPGLQTSFLAMGTETAPLFNSTLFQPQSRISLADPGTH